MYSYVSNDTYSNDTYTNPLTILHGRCTFFKQLRHIHIVHGDSDGALGRTAVSAGDCGIPRSATTSLRLAGCSVVDAAIRRYTLLLYRG